MQAPQIMSVASTSGSPQDRHWNSSHGRSDLHGGQMQVESDAEPHSTQRGGNSKSNKVCS